MTITQGNADPAECRILRASSGVRALPPRQMVRFSAGREQGNQTARNVSFTRLENLQPANLLNQISPPRAPLARPISAPGQLDPGHSSLRRSSPRTPGKQASRRSSRSGSSQAASNRCPCASWWWSSAHDGVPKGTDLPLPKLLNSFRVGVLLSADTNSLRGMRCPDFPAQ